MALLGIGVQDHEADMRQFMNEGGWSFPVALLPDSVPAAYGINAVPTLVIVRPGGRILKVLVGGASAADLTKMMDDLTG